MTTQALTLVNDYHNTQHTLRLKPATGVYAGYWTITPNQSYRSWKSLCGIKSCWCSGDLGDRGPKDYETIALFRDGEIVVKIKD